MVSEPKASMQRLEGSELAEVMRQVFARFTIGKTGYGLTQKAWVESYEFRDDFKQLLAQSTTFATHIPVCDIVHWLLKRAFTP